MTVSNDSVSANRRTAFWIVAALGVLILCAAWFWYGLAYSEEMTDNDPGTSTPGIGLGLLLGGIPVIVVHGLLLLTLVLIGWRYHARRAVGVVLAVVAVGIASAVGIAVSQLLWAGCLFAMSASQTCPAYIP